MRKRTIEVALLTLLVMVCGATLHAAEGPWEPAGLQGYNIWALEIGPSGQILAGTAGAFPSNTIFRSSDGAFWESAADLPGAEVWDIEIDPSDESIVYAGLNGDGVWKSLDSGATWAWSNLYGQIWEIDVSPTDPSVLYVASQNGGMYKSIDAGDSWTLLDLGEANNATAVAVHPTNPDIAVAGTPFWGIFRTIDGGASWSAVNTGFDFTPDVRSLLFDTLDPTTVYAGEMSNGVFKSLDGGLTWTRPDPSFFATADSIKAIGGDIYVTNTFDDDGNPAYRSQDAGLTWAPLSRQPELPGNLWPRALAVMPDAVLIGTDLVPNPGGIFRWELPHTDMDGDGVADDVDNCPSTPNPGQSDVDIDTWGDLCDECPADPDQNCRPGGSTAEEIPADQGGSLETPDGAATLVIEPGDLPEDSTLSITEWASVDPIADLILDTGNGRGEPLATYRFEPDGLEFNQPVTLTLIVDVSDLNRGQRSHIDLYLYSDTNGDGVEDSYVGLDAACAIVEDPARTFTATCTAELAHLSSYSMIAPLDTDGDEVPDYFGAVVDICLETVIPEGVPLRSLVVNRFALVDADTVFDTRASQGRRQSITYSTSDTAGCSCEQIIAALDLGQGHVKFGCSIGAMKAWVGLVSP